MKTVGSITVLTVFAAMTSVSAMDNLKAFPAAEHGMVRHVLQLPQQDDESAFKVEVRYRVWSAGPKAEPVAKG